MAKLTKKETAGHRQALERLEKETLTEEDKEFIFANYHEGATNTNSEAGAFFTPLSLAWDVSCETNTCIDNPAIIDLCAGIGVLAYCCTHRHPGARVVCVDINPEYVEVGRRLVPAAEWHCLDAFQIEEIQNLGQFHYAISNPPFGNPGSCRNKKGPVFQGKDAEYKIIDIAAEVADLGVFIIPQESAGFRYSGTQCYERRESLKYQRFKKQTGIDLEIGMGINTSTYEGWKGVCPRVEVVRADLTERVPVEEVYAGESNQMALFP